MLPAALGLLALTPPCDAEEKAWRFDFGSGPPAPGFTAVRSDQRFTPVAGHGFDLAGRPVEHADDVGGRGGFYFSIAVPEGCYQVSARLGGSPRASDTSIKAESRRWMVGSVRTQPGESVTASFTVHVRRPAIPGGEFVRLKERERDYLHWDDKLTLEFNGPEPSVDAIEIRPVVVPVLHLLGDSTVADQPYEPWSSWGQMLTHFFSPEVAVANHAESGESIRSSLSARRIEKLYRSLKPGDFVLVQYGHNDMKDKSPDALATYRSNLEAIVREVRKHDAQPVLITSMERKSGVTKDTLGDYPDTVRLVARNLEVPLIDLHAMSRLFYQALGTRLDLAFQDGTHHNTYGSYQLAKCVVEGIRTQVPDLAKNLRAEVKPFDPSQPDPPEAFVYPPSLVNDLTKPDGD